MDAAAWAPWTCCTTPLQSAMPLLTALGRSLALPTPSYPSPAMACSLPLGPRAAPVALPATTPPSPACCTLQMYPLLPQTPPSSRPLPGPPSPCPMAAGSTLCTVWMTPFWSTRPTATQWPPGSPPPQSTGGAVTPPAPSAAMPCMPRRPIVRPPLPLHGARGAACPCCRRRLSSVTLSPCTWAGLTRWGGGAFR